VVDEVVEERQATACDSQFAAPSAPEIVEFWNPGAGGLRVVGCTEVFQ
jgi:hypothetical protein